MISESLKDLSFFILIIYLFTSIRLSYGQSIKDNIEVNPSDNVIQPRDHQPSKVASEPVSDIDLNQFLDYGFIFLKKSDLKIKSDDPKDKVSPLNFDYQKFILDEVIQTNKALILKMVKSVNTNQELDSKNILLYRDRIIEAIDPNYFGTTNKKRTSSKAFKDIDTVDIFIKKNLTGIILNDADLVKLYEVEVNGESQKMVSLKGGVDITFNDNMLRALEVDINIATRNIYGRGKVELRVGENSVKGDNVLLDLSNQVGYLFNSKGIQEGNYFQGKLFKVNEKNHFTVEEGWITFSTNPDPYYRLKISGLDSYGKDKAIYRNVLVTVHNQPFFWVPYFIRYPTSTSLNLTFGENRRVGYYILTKTSFDLPYISKLLLNFNVYEKLGLYFSLQNINKVLNSNYNLLVALAYYTENFNIKEKPEKLTYTYHTGQYLTSVSSLRHKVEYTHNFNFVDNSQNLVKSSLSFKMKNVSDPFITHNFPLNLKHFDLRKLIERHDRDELLYTASPSDRDHYSVNYNLSAPSASLGINLGWNYDIYQDHNKSDLPIDEQYTMYLKTMTLPKINFSLSSTFDPYTKDSDRKFHLNLGYKTSLFYSATYNYKNGVEMGQGSGNTTSVEPYELTKENFSFKLNGSLSRNFTIDQDKNSLWDLGFDWFSWNLNHSMSTSYSKNWVGKDHTTSDDTKDDKTDFSIGYNFSSTMNFNTGLATWFDFVLNNSWGISKSETTYQHSPDDILKFDLLNSETTKNYRSSYSFSMKFNFPSSTLKGIWNNAYDYRSMLPVFSLNLFTFNLKKRTSQEKIAEGDKYAFDIYESRNFSSSLSMTHKGYGLFYIPDFNYVFTSSASLSYDLMPVKDENGNFTQVNYFNDKSFWKDSRFNSFNGNTKLNINYKIWNWYNSLNYNFYRTDTKELDPLLNQFSTRTTISYKQTGGRWVNLDSISLEYKWIYNFRENKYKSDSMSMSIKTQLDILKYFKVDMSFSSVNNNAYRYFESKAGHFGDEKVDFFEDIFASFGFLGVEKQQSALFKMGAFSVGIIHDLDDWYSRFSYTLAPVNYSKESLSGFYFDHKIQFEVNIRPKHDPRGPAESRNNPYFETIEKSYTPEGF